MKCEGGREDMERSRSCEGGATLTLANPAGRACLEGRPSHHPGLGGGVLG